VTIDAHIASAVGLAAAIGWTMVFSGQRKRLLEPKARRRRCPSCGHVIAGRVCGRH
jgi:hypothetical protein